MSRSANILLTLVSSFFIFAVVPDSLKQDSVTTMEDSLSITKPESLTGKKNIQFPEIENRAFKIGEKLHFKIRYGFIRASGFNWFYKVEDEVDSYMDKWGLFSWKFDKKLREGGYKVDIHVDYDPYHEKAHVNYTRYHSDMTLKEKKS